MATRQELLAQLMSAGGNVTTGAARPRATPKPPSQAARVDRNRMRAEILAQQSPMPHSQHGMIAPVEATQVAVVGNIAKAILRNRQRKKSDAESRDLLGKELDMAQGEDPFADELQPIEPPVASGQVDILEGPGADDALVAAVRGVRAHKGAADATAAVEKPARDAHDLAALRSGGAEGELAAMRLFPDPGEDFTLGENDKRFDAQGNEIASGPAKPEQAPDQWETYTDAAGNTLQRNKVTGEAKRVVEAPSPAPDDRTDDVREYEYAKAGGYEGTFEEWQVLMGRSRAPRAAQNVPEGYQAEYDENGNIVKLTPVPGGPAALKHDAAQREADAAAAKTRAQEDQQAALRAGEVGQADIVTQDIDRMLETMDSSGLSGVGALSGVKDIPVLGSLTDAKAVEGFLDTIKANIGFDQLQQMREASPTGGALGQVTERELSLLQAVAGDLEQSRDDDQLRYNLNRLWNGYMDVIHGAGNGPPRRALDFKPEASRQKERVNAPTQPQVSADVLQRVQSYYDRPRQTPQPTYNGGQTGALPQ